jgi:hypothetical protein
MKKAVVLALAAALFSAAATTLVTQAASAKDDPVKLKADRDAFRKKMKEKKVWCYFDLSYGVDSTKVDSRWSAPDPPVSDAKEDEGIQFKAAFSAPAAAEGAAIDILIIKFPHKAVKDGKGVKYTREFPRAGKTVDCSDMKGMVDGFYLDQFKTYTEHAKDKCVEPTKAKAAGPADYWGSVTGMNPEAKVKERSDYFGWLGPNITWIAIVTYKGVYVAKAEDFTDKVFDLMKATKELDPPK